jgi:hypothetical protein
MMLLHLQAQWRHIHHLMPMGLLIHTAQHFPTMATRLGNMMMLVCLLYGINA